MRACSFTTSSGTPGAVDVTAYVRHTRTAAAAQLKTNMSALTPYAQWSVHSSYRNHRTTPYPQECEANHAATIRAQREKSSGFPATLHPASDYGLDAPSRVSSALLMH